MRAKIKYKKLFGKYSLKVKVGNIWQFMGLFESKSEAREFLRGDRL